MEGSLTEIPRRLIDHHQIFEMGFSSG